MLQINVHGPPHVFDLVDAIFVNLSTVDKFIVRGGVRTTDFALDGAVSAEGIHEFLDFMNNGNCVADISESWHPMIAHVGIAFSTLKLLLTGENILFRFLQYRLNRNAYFQYHKLKLMGYHSRIVRDNDNSVTSRMMAEAQFVQLHQELLLLRIEAAAPPVAPPVVQPGFVLIK